MIELFEVAPHPEEFCALRVAAGLSPKDLTAAASALPLSLYAVCLRDGHRLVGMGRVVGDGLHVQVTDIAVHPDHQGRGLSRMIMESIMGYISTLPPSTGVSLFADVDWLYQKFGFTVPTESTGMYLTALPSATERSAE